MSTHNDWSGFTVGAQEWRLGTRRNVTKWQFMVDITCPYCQDSFDVAASSARQNKSNACKTHLTNHPSCAQQHGAFTEPPSKQKRRNPAPPPPAATDGNDADVSEAGSPQASPSLRWRPGAAHPPIAEGVPLAPTEGELRAEQLETAVAERKAAQAREQAALAEMAAAKAKTALAKARLKLLLADAGVSPPASSDDDAEIVSKRQRAGDAHKRDAYNEVAEAARISPSRDGETVVVLGTRVVSRVRTEEAQARQMRGVRTAAKRLRKDEHAVKFMKVALHPDKVGQDSHEDAQALHTALGL